MRRIKPAYKIPMSINLGRWDTPISLKKGSVGLKPTTFKIITIVTISFMFWLVTALYMVQHDFGIFYCILFTIGFVMLCRLSIKRERHGEMGYKTFVPIYRYWISYNNRLIKTRGSADSREVSKLKWQIPIEDINEETGVIEYTNGDVGMTLMVIGNGSRALFVEEKENIITAFEDFLKELKLEVSVTVESKQSRQDCREQIFNLEQLKQKNSDPEIDQVISERIDILENVIQKRFKSTQQYLHLRAPDEERLFQCMENLQRQRGKGMLRHIEVLRGEKQEERLREFFSLS
ncbi:hypothetical protein QI425_13010 [Staphylococcus aureus]|uniref:hypothetical protein n=1 Tax=Staphylococcus aureus TaxID=1280 RepID=UPI000A483B94|nr:hypothetical protein [Staphylococcus aureus]MBG1130537.1 hypothetical protein [Staphylococcus aureus]MCA1235789.1 hypothetical protein [Staphylococcus aureus]MDI1662490.1 hypothetical protein [Staphylococcus aureus]MDI1957437.1 hypothetical protein [Staphylococcus aureus]HDJ2913349.1 hypothetical protein [Staphylococcus aureus]